MEINAVVEKILLSSIMYGFSGEFRPSFQYSPLGRARPLKGEVSIEISSTSVFILKISASRLGHSDLGRKGNSNVYLSAPLRLRRYQKRAPDQANSLAHTD